MTSLLDETDFELIDSTIPFLPLFDEIRGWYYCAASTQWCGRHVMSLSHKAETFSMTFRCTS